MSNSLRRRDGMSNFYEQDINIQQILQNKLSSEFYSWADKQLNKFGEKVSGSIDHRAKHTDREGQPRLIKYDKMGNEVNEIWLNDGYQQTIKETYETGIVGYIHKEIPDLGYKGNYVYAFALGYLLSHAEPGFYCPVTLTKATAYLIDRYASRTLKEKYLPHVLSTGEEELYEGATFLTERQGGSDVGANVVKAVEENGVFNLYGEKYFASNAGACGVAMVLARKEGAVEGTKGLSLFLVPWEENRVQGKLQVRRLKDKLGVRAVPSAEIEFSGATAYLVGKADQGFYYMMEALNLSRVCNATASLGIMRRAYLEAKNYCKKRNAFGKALTDYPMVQDSLASLVAKQEIEVAALFEVIELMDKVMGDEESKISEEESALFRLYVALLKKETAEQAISFSHESIELHGGNGYIEDFITPRLLRDAQVLTVWEGTANILGLEVLRLIKKYRVDHLFINEMIKRIAFLETNQNSMKSWKSLVQSEISKLQGSIEQVEKLSEDLQTYHCKSIGDVMIKIYESVIALEQLEANDERKKAVSEVYLQKTWTTTGELEREPVTLKYFDLLTNDEKLLSTNR